MILVTKLVMYYSFSFFCTEESDVQFKKVVCLMVSAKVSCVLMGYFVNKTIIWCIFSWSSVQCEKASPLYTDELSMPKMLDARVLCFPKFCQPNQLF